MTPAIQKLKAKLYSRLTAAQLGIDAESEEVIEPTGKLIGGLRYLIGRPHAKLEIVHFEKQQFNIFVEIAKPGAQPINRIAVTVPFNSVDLEVRRIVEVVMSDD